MRAWLFQDHRQKEKLGDAAPWSVGFVDPEGRRRSKRIGSKSMAEKFRRKIEGQLAAGSFESQSSKTWTGFRKEFDAKIAAGMKPQTKRCTLEALDHFQRIIKPQKVAVIKTQTIDQFVVQRRKEEGRKSETLSPATVNRDLRHIRAVLRIAHDWGYLLHVPKVRMLKEPKKLPRYMTPEDFAAIYSACEAAKRPEGLPFSAAAWWRALLTFAYMTGWRIGEILALRRDDLDLEAGAAITRAADNKGGRDEKTPLHEVVVDHLRQIVCFEPMVFPWYYHERTLWTDFGSIQEAAGIKPHYGFHDLRRAFATVNAEKLTADALQALMRHKSYSTTQRYINIARQLNRAVDSLYVPDVLRKVN